ncbi:MAG: HAMP domain-containing sensor histidine kinase [Bacteroidales bacterium]|jgi:two-component system phosphate regulon sensor histidine kinase PhoR|nr:HAMP domain-containing sensor histidine kinase [Bacteroidales bacterium]
MNRRKFKGLIVLMVVSILAIVWVQVTWISNSVKSQNEQFDFFVINSLRNTAHSMETNRRMNFLNEMFIRGYSALPQAIQRSAQPGIETESFSIQSSVTSDTDSVEIIVSTNDNPPVRMKVTREEARNRMGNSIVVGSDEYMRWMQQQASEFQTMSNQLVSEMFVWERNRAVNKEELLHTLQGELTASGIDTPFEFALIRGDSIIDGVYSKVRKKELMESPYKVNLFAQGLLWKGETLSVVFPRKTNYVLGTMGLMLGGFGLFLLIIMATFALSLWFIIRQKKTSEMQADFINNMTHEFKTPIATISLAADTIANNRVITDEEKVRHFIGMIKKENSRMNRQVESILQIATLDKHEMDFSFTETDLHEVISQAIDTIGIQVTDRGGVINRHLEAENSVITGDSEHLRNLVHNLLDNANKYSEGAPQITVTTRSNGSGLFLEVADKGIGMSKAVQNRVFERFYRETTGDIHNVKGFGLGLNYVKAITDAHGGTVTVESEPGRGSIFTVFLPYKSETRA